MRGRSVWAVLIVACGVTLAGCGGSSVASPYAGDPNAAIYGDYQATSWNGVAHPTPNGNIVLHIQPDAYILTTYFTGTTQPPYEERSTWTLSGNVLTLSMYANGRAYVWAGTIAPKQSITMDSGTYPEKATFSYVGPSPSR